MSFAKVSSAQTTFLSAHIVDIEVDLSNGLHSFSIVGLGDKAVEESKDRVAAAIKNTGFKSPKVKNQKVVISLAPADIKKEGPLFDVGIAIGYLIAAEEISCDPSSMLFLGELSLDGELRRINGILPLVRHAKEKGFKEIFVPKANAKEAALIEGVHIYGCRHLYEIVEHITQSSPGKGHTTKMLPVAPTCITLNAHHFSVDFKDIKGHEEVKRALEIAAAGGHNSMLYGPPGTGKTMLAKAFPHILPPLTFDEILETTSIHSIAGLLKQDYITHPPLRAPHHSTSHTALIGGGREPTLGEITLAHRGVLFLDEFPEFDRRVIDSLREPLEEKEITITRTKGRASFPAHFILIAAMNPCPCGYFQIEGKECTCSIVHVKNYQRKISGPIIDRIDIWVEVSKIEYETLSSTTPTKSTREIQKRVAEARQIQKERFQGTSIKTNGEMSVKDIQKWITLPTSSKNILNKAAEKLGLSIRSYHRVIKLAQTIADLDKEALNDRHVLEALQYRPRKDS